MKYAKIDKFDREDYVLFFYFSAIVAECLVSIFTEI